MADGKWLHFARPDLPLAEAARHALLLRLQAVADCLPPALGAADQDPEHVHQLRVATRRAAAALRIFRDCLPRRVFRKARRRLRRLRRAAGAARDWDVFLIALNERRKRHPPEEHAGLDFLAGHAFAARAAAQAELQRVGQKVATDFEQSVLATAGAARGGGGETLRSVARPTIAELLAGFDGALAGDVADHAHLHRVRIAGKRLRYAMEVFADCFAPLFRERLYPLVVELQDVLGRINDSHVAGGRLAELIGRLRGNVLADWDRLRPGVEAFARYHRERLERERQKFAAWHERWRAADAPALVEASAGPIEPAGAADG